MAAVVSFLGVGKSSVVGRLTFLGRNASHVDLYVNH